MEKCEQMIGGDLKGARKKGIEKEECTDLVEKKRHPGWSVEERERDRKLESEERVSWEAVKEAEQGSRCSTVVERETVQSRLKYP